MGFYESDLLGLHAQPGPGTQYMFPEWPWFPHRTLPPRSLEVPHCLSEGSPLQLCMLPGKPRSCGLTLLPLPAALTVLRTTSHAEQGDSTGPAAGSASFYSQALSKPLHRLSFSIVTERLD